MYIPSEKGLIRPPGSPDEIQFLLICKRCGKCLNACEYGTIKKSSGEFGASVGTPYLTFRGSYCRMCMKCTMACENDVLKKTDNIKIGTAVIDENLCLSWNGIICTTCYSYCPYSAVFLDEKLRPHIKKEKCNGCGYCENVCVKYPAIKVKKYINI